jgi:hypothetical protein
MRSLLAVLAGCGTAAAMNGPCPAIQLGAGATGSTSEMTRN